MFEGTDSVLLNSKSISQTYLTNPLKRRIYLCKIPATMITEVLFKALVGVFYQI